MGLHTGIAQPTGASRSAVAASRPGRSKNPRLREKSRFHSCELRKRVGAGHGWQNDSFPGKACTPRDNCFDARQCLEVVKPPTAIQSAPLSSEATSRPEKHGSVSESVHIRTMCVHRRTLRKANWSSKLLIYDVFILACRLHGGVDPGGKCVCSITVMQRRPVRSPGQSRITVYSTGLKVTPTVSA